LVDRLVAAFATVDAVRLGDAMAVKLRGLVEEAVGCGARVHGVLSEAQRPVLLTGVRAEMEIARADMFAPVVSLIEVADTDEVVRVQEACPFALTASVFGEEREARAMGARMTVGTVVVNDLIVPTADPRVPFGGRRMSGFGVTRGAEGLLEMTAVRTIAVKRGGSRRHFEVPTVGHEGLFEGVIGMSHGRGFGARLAGLMRVVRAGKDLNGRR